MMLRKEHGGQLRLSQPVAMHKKFLYQQASKEQFFLHPYGHRRQERLDAFRGESEIRFEQPFEFDEGFIVKDQVLHVLQPDSTRSQAVVHCPMRKSRIVLFPGKALFLRRCDDLPVLYQRGRAIMIEG